MNQRFGGPAGAVEVLRDLPRLHQKHLLYIHRNWIKKSWNPQRKFEVIAARLGPNGTLPYTNLYLEENGSHFAWYLYERRPLHLATIYNRLTANHPGILTGLHPHLEHGQPPQLNRLIEYGSSLAIEYGSMDASRTIVQNWRTRKVYVDRVYRVVIRDKPFTIEVRAPGAARQQQLLDLVQAELGRDLSNNTPCHIRSDEQRVAVQEGLGSAFTESDLACTADGLKAMKLRASAEDPLDESEEYRVQMEERDGRDELRQGYEFRAVHADNFGEKSALQHHARDR